MKKGGLLSSIIFFYLAVFLKAEANFYAGFGASLSKHSYSTNANIENNKALQNTNAMLQSSGNNVVLYNSMQQHVAAGEFLANGVTSGFTINVNTQQFNNGATTDDVLQGLGAAYLASMVRSGIVTLNSTSQAEIDSLSLQIGKTIAQVAFGKTNPTAQDFLTGDGIIFQGIPGVLPPNNWTVQIQVPDPINRPQEYLAFVQAFASVNQSIVGIFNRMGIIFPDSIPTSAEGSGVEISIAIGYLAKYKKIYYGFETALDAGKNKVGSNDNNEIEVKYNFMISTVGKLGVSLVNNSFNYIMVGASFRDYKTYYFGLTNSTFTPHLLIGTGMEFVFAKQLNLFTEFAYITTLSKINTEINGRELNFKSQKLTVGVRYYFDQNPVLNTSLSNANRMDERQKTAKSMETVFAPEPSPKDEGINFKDKTKVLSPEEVRVQEIRTEMRREFGVEQANAIKPKSKPKAKPVNTKKK